MKRWKTTVVEVGKVGVGGDNPIRIQSMTTSNTRDVEATVLQIKRLADYGCEIARVTVQGKKESEACALIKNALVKDGYDIPLVADIHFYPPAAMLVAEYVDKVRINPGNFVDKRAIFKTKEYTDELYNQEILKIEEGFSPLVLKCKERGIAMRIGTNHGSLSDRIMNRYGDTSKGMVESALEFARVCRAYDYHNFLFSMKASNPLVMIEAYRLLVEEMEKLGWNYPLHLGVTEAGDGEDGRVKSAVGMGALLLDGFGDTIRMSLTEDPWHEIDPCKRLLSFVEKQQQASSLRKPIKRNHPRGIVVVKATKDDLDTLKGKELDIFLLDEKISLKEPVWVLDDLPEDVYHSKEGSLDGISEKAKTILLELSSKDRVFRACQFFARLQKEGIDLPVIFYFSYNTSKEDLIIQAAAELGSLFADGYGEGIALNSPQDVETNRLLSFSILQGARLRNSKTEFIACPGCGRTLFDLQSVTQKIRAKTSHLPGVKIAIMGCIVNGPGEMADADFGYVGSLPGKIDLYVGKTCVEKGLSQEDAEDRLIALIKSHGKWLEPTTHALIP